MAGMARRARCAHRSFSLQIERLEARALLSADVPAASSASTVDPANSIMVRFKAGASPALTSAAIRAVKGTVASSFPNGSELITLSPAENPSLALRLLKSNRTVVYAESGGTIQASTIPNDPSLASQWGVNNGNNVDIDAPEAWSISTGNSSIIVAVLDTGIDLRNPEFANRLWTNPTAGVDGYSGDVHGWNFVSNNGNVQDNNGHGTHVTGILAATGNNGYGVAGVDWNAQIMPLKILASDGGGSTNAAVQGIYFAVNHGARVISASWGGNQYSQAMRDAIGYANSRNVVFVTAAGNDGVNNDPGGGNYPANYRLPNELVVAAVDVFGNLAGFSDYGANTVDVAAPGVNVWSTIPGGFASYSGTSMATPFVSGVVSLVAGQHPELSASALVHRIIATAKPLPSLTGKLVSGGIVDAYNALTDTEPQQGGVAASEFDRPSFNGVVGTLLATDDAYKASGGTPTGYVTRLYQSIFGRTPDSTGLAYYANKITSGVSRADVIHELQSYDEAYRAEVARWYQKELSWSSTIPFANLKVDPGVVSWANLIDSGVSEDRVHAMILAAGLAPGGSGRDAVQAYYTSALGRAPDAAGLDYYSGQIQQGISRVDVALNLLDSLESRRTEFARFFQDEFGWKGTVTSLKVDPGVVYWAGVLGGW